MKTPPVHSIRRSVVLPISLVQEAKQVAAPDLKNNTNRLVTVALREFVSRRRAQELEAQMAQMAQDPGIRAESAALAQEFRAAETDGLPNR